MTHLAWHFRRTENDACLPDPTAAASLKDADGKASSCSAAISASICARSRAAVAFAIRSLASSCSATEHVPAYSCSRDSPQGLQL